MPVPISTQHQFGAQSTAEEIALALAREIHGKNVLITGASPGGLGAEAARVIAKYGAGLVIVAGRSLCKLEETIQSIKAETPDANIRPLVLDLESFEEVRKAAAEVNAYDEPINVLINNAGIMAIPYKTTIDGHESQFGINHLAHFLFTALIFPRLVAGSTSTSSYSRTSSPSRIVSVSSVGHMMGDVQFDDLTFSHGETYDKWKAYGQSKTANALFANEISRRSKEAGVEVLAYSLHPGAISTNLITHITDDEWKAMGLMGSDGNFLYSPKDIPAGTATHIAAAFDPSIRMKPGTYLTDAQINEKDRLDYARSEANGRRLWDLSEVIVGTKFFV